MVPDLPVMREPAWQRLAGSCTSGTIGRSRKDVEGEDKAETSGSSGGGGDNVLVVDVQKPKAVAAVGWAA